MIRSTIDRVEPPRGLWVILIMVHETTDFKRCHRDSFLLLVRGVCLLSKQTEEEGTRYPYLELISILRELFVPHARPFEIFESHKPSAIVHRR